MAFLCPSRLGAKKKRRGYQSMLMKVTCDGNKDLNIGDLIKLSYYTPESRRIVLQNFTACADHELSVKQGQKVNFVYQEGDWAYVCTDDKKQGYIPLNVCAKIGKKQSEVENRDYIYGFHQQREVRESPGVGARPDSTIGSTMASFNPTEDSYTISSCSDDDGLYDSFTEWSNDSDDNDTPDVTVAERDVIGMTVENGQPVAYVRSKPFDRSPVVFEAIRGQQRVNSELLRGSSTEENPPSPTGVYKVLYDYKGTNRHDITVRADDVVFLQDTSDHEWFWVQLPTGQQGYIPSNYIRPLEPNEFIGNQIRMGEELGKDMVSKDKLPIEQNNMSTIDHPLPIPEPRYSLSQEKKASVHDGQNKTRLTSVEENTPTHFPKPKQNSVKSEQNHDNPQTARDNNNGKAHSQSKSDKEKVHQLSNRTSSRHHSRSDHERRSNRTKKQPPQKPPRKNKAPNSLSPRSLDSMDTTFESTDTSIIDSEITRDDIHNEIQPDKHKELDGLKARTDSFIYACIESRSKTLPATSTNKNSDLDRKNKQDSRRNKPKHDKRLTDSRRACRGSDRSRRGKEPQVKPMSPTPVVKSFEEYRRGYFDEIFYEEKGGNKFNAPNNDKHVVNVSEIMKERARRLKDITNHSGTVKRAERQTAAITGIPTVKQYLMNLPVARLDQVKPAKDKQHTDNERKDIARPRQNKPSTNETSDSKGVVKARHPSAEQPNDKRYPSTIRNKPPVDQRHAQHHLAHKHKYGSANDLRHINNKGNSTKTYGSTSDLRKFNNIDNSHKYGSTNDLGNIRYDDNWSFRPRSNTHGTEFKRHTDANKCPSNPKAKQPAKPESPDWSFGYPRKMKPSTHETHNNLGRTDFMVEFLAQTAGSLDRADDDTFQSDSEYFESDVFESDGEYESDDEEDSIVTEKGSSGVDINDKCFSFVQSSTIGIHGMGVSNEPRGNVFEMQPLKNTSDNMTKEHSNTRSNERASTRKRSSGDYQSWSDLSTSGSRSGPVRSYGSISDLQNEPNLNYGSISNLSRLDVRGVTEFVAQGNYEPEADNELPLKHGEIVHVCLDQQDNENWYWAFSPRLKQYGFVPRHNVKIPLVTII